MATFMDVHSGFFGVTADQSTRRTTATSRSSRRGRPFRPGLARPRGRQGLLPRDGTVAGVVMRIHERAGHPTPEIYELTVEV